MSKQSGYQQLSSEGPSAQEYGFAARLPQAGDSCQSNGEYHGPGQTSGTSYDHMARQMAYPGEAYAGAPVTGYPMMTTPVAGPVGMVALDPLGRRERKRERRHGRAAGGHRRRRVGPVGLLVGLVKSALQSSQGQQGHQGHQGHQGNQDRQGHQGHQGQQGQQGQW